MTSPQPSPSPSLDPPLPIGEIIPPSFPWCGTFVYDFKDVEPFNSCSACNSCPEDESRVNLPNSVVGSVTSTLKSGGGYSNKLTLTIGSTIEYNVWKFTPRSIEVDLSGTETVPDEIYFMSDYLFECATHTYEVDGMMINYSASLLIRAGKFPLPSFNAPITIEVVSSECDSDCKAPFIHDLREGPNDLEYPSSNGSQNDFVVNTTSVGEASSSEMELLYVMGSVVPEDDYRQHGNPSGEYVAEYTESGERTGTWVHRGWERFGLIPLGEITEIVDYDTGKVLHRSLPNPSNQDSGRVNLGKYDNVDGFGYVQVRESLQP